jgi:hypothetical protein
MVIPKPSVAMARYGPFKRRAGSPKIKPKADETNPAMGRAIQRGKLQFKMRITLVKAPIAKNPAWPIDI